MFQQNFSIRLIFGYIRSRKSKAWSELLPRYPTVLFAPTNLRKYKPKKEKKKHIISVRPFFRFCQTFFFSTFQVMPKYQTVIQSSIVSYISIATKMPCQNRLKEQRIGIIYHFWDDNDDSARKHLHTLLGKSYGMDWGLAHSKCRNNDMGTPGQQRIIVKKKKEKNYKQLVSTDFFAARVIRVQEERMGQIWKILNSGQLSSELSHVWLIFHVYVERKMAGQIMADKKFEVVAGVSDE